METFSIPRSISHFFFRRGCISLSRDALFILIRPECSKAANYFDRVLLSTFLTVGIRETSIIFRSEIDKTNEHQR